MERGRKSLGSDGLISLSRFFGVNPQWLLTGEGEMRPEGQPKGDYLDPDLARIVMAEIKGRQGKEPLKISAREAALLEMIRDLPETEQKQIEYEIMTA